MKKLEDFPGGPVVNILCCNTSSMESTPDQGIKIPHAMQPKKKIKDEETGALEVGKYTYAYTTGKWHEVMEQASGKKGPSDHEPELWPCALHCLLLTLLNSPSGQGHGNQWWAL